MGWNGLVLPRAYPAECEEHPCLTLLRTPWWGTFGEKEDRCGVSLNRKNMKSGSGNHFNWESIQKESGLVGE